jgi:hypothetical protein
MLSTILFIPKLIIYIVTFGSVNYFKSNNADPVHDLHIVRLFPSLEVGPDKIRKIVDNFTEGEDFFLSSKDISDSIRRLVDLRECPHRHMSDEGGFGDSEHDTLGQYLADLDSYTGCCKGCFPTQVIATTKMLSKLKNSGAFSITSKTFTEDWDYEDKLEVLSDLDACHDEVVLLIANKQLPKRCRCCSEKHENTYSLSESMCIRCGHRSQPESSEPEIKALNDRPMDRVQ